MGSTWGWGYTRFLGRNDTERRIMINSIAHTGTVTVVDHRGRCVCLLLADGLRCGVVGFYVAMITVLASFFRRSFDLRSRLKTRAGCQHVGTGRVHRYSFVPPLVIGVAFDGPVAGRTVPWMVSASVLR